MSRDSSEISAMLIALAHAQIDSADLLSKRVVARVVTPPTNRLLYLRALPVVGLLWPQRHVERGGTHMIQEIVRDDGSQAADAAATDVDDWDLDDWDYSM